MPQILAVNISPAHPHLARLVFSPKLSLPLSTDQLIKLKLKSGQTISRAGFQRLVNYSFAFQLKNHALRLIAFCPQTELMIEQKLNIYLKKLVFRLNLSPQNPNKIIKKILSYLQKKQFLNPVDFASSFLRKHSSKSAAHLRLLLQKKGIDPDLIPQFLSDPALEIKKIKAIIQKKSPHKSKKQIISYLYRQGFSYPNIKKTIDETDNLS